MCRTSRRARSFPGAHALQSSAPARGTRRATALRPPAPSVRPLLTVGVARLAQILARGASEQAKTLHWTGAFGSTANGIRSLVAHHSISSGRAKSGLVAGETPGPSIRPSPVGSGRIRVMLAHNWRALSHAEAAPDRNALSQRRPPRGLRQPRDPRHDRAAQYQLCGVLRA